MLKKQYPEWNKFVKEEDITRHKVMFISAVKSGGKESLSRATC